jgi:aquaporin Z
MSKYITEFIGTFFLVLTVFLTVTGGSPLAPLAIGSILMIMVYMGGHISGGHYNPAVTLGVWMRGKLELRDAIQYWIYQLVGGIVAALVGAWLSGASFAPAPGASTLPALVAEFIFTFALVLVVLDTATADETEGNSYFGLAIGFTVMVGAFAVGDISGGAFNPAVGLGPIIVDGIMNGGSFANVWLYLVGPLLGGAAAAYVFKIQHS